MRNSRRSADDRRRSARTRSGGARALDDYVAISGFGTVGEVHSDFRKLISPGPSRSRRGRATAAVGARPSTAIWVFKPISR